MEDAIRDGDIEQEGGRDPEPETGRKGERTENEERAKDRKIKGE